MSFFDFGVIILEGKEPVRIVSPSLRSEEKREVYKRSEP